eukprot:4667287-Alexandrium_andersonii.AAC.1
MSPTAQCCFPRNCHFKPGHGRAGQGRAREVEVEMREEGRRVHRKGEGGGAGRNWIRQRDTNKVEQCQSTTGLEQTG